MNREQSPWERMIAQTERARVAFQSGKIDHETAAVVEEFMSASFSLGRSLIKSQVLEEGSAVAPTAKEMSEFNGALQKLRESLKERKESQDAKRSGR